MKATAAQIAAFLNGRLVGPDLELSAAESASSAGAGSLVFIRSQADRELIDHVNGLVDVCVLTTEATVSQLYCSTVVVENPRLAFALALEEFFVEHPGPSVSNTAVIATSASIASDVTIGEFAVIEEDVTIGAGSTIGHHVVIKKACRIGQACNIKTHAVIGDDGFGYEYEYEGGRPIKMPHLGAVKIGDRVEVGAATVIARGTLEDTVIGDDTKIDDHVFIAHNVQVGANCLIIAGAEVSGSVRIGDSVWIAPQATLLNQVTVGDRAMVGIGSVVIRPVEPDTVVAGNPARPLRKRDQNDSLD